MDSAGSFVLYHKLQSNATELVLLALATLLSGRFIYSYLKKKENCPPGPIGLPVVGYLPFLGSEPHKTLWKLKEKYGDVIG